MEFEQAKHPELGGTDGFRGVATEEVGPGKMNPETIAGMTYALVRQQMEAGEPPLCAIGRDTRLSGSGLAYAAIAGAREAGAEVVWMDVAPTPAVLKTAQELGAGAAVVISASHNKHTDNGWKGTLGADKPVGEQITAISDRYWEEVDSGRIFSLAVDSATWRPGLTERYMSHVVSDIERTFGERPLDGKLLVVDAANGAAMNVTPSVLRRLGATIEEFACDGNGYINDGCGATDLNGVQDFLRRRSELVKDPNFIGVVANDGDADRMMGLGAVMKNDELNFDDLVLDGNRVIELLAQGQPGIVGTDYTNDALVARLKEQGIKFEFCRNGDVNVTGALLRRQANGENWTRGGEISGHHVDTTWLSSGDGVRMAAWVAAYAAVNGTNFAEIGRSMPLWPEKQTKIELVPGMDGQELLGKLSVLHAIEEAKSHLSLGRTHIRPSGTEPVIRVWAVDPEATRVERVATLVSAAIHGEVARAA